jgi:RimJ/RimL family protein N-acetyltransferase
LRFVSRQTEEAWLQQKAASAPGEINLAICLTPAGEHIGNLYLRDINWVARHAEIHMFIGETKLRGKGYGASALRQIMAHAFDTLGLQRIFLYVLADNRAAIRLYETCGFVVEGRLKRHAFKSGKFKDMLVMGLCAAG